MDTPITAPIELTESAVARFWRKVEKSDGCWLWQSKLDRKGYGRFYIGGGREHPREGFAHRVSYAIAFGDVPQDHFVLHRCDNPQCVRPDHLFAGTQADNIRDMTAKGRAVYRERNTVCAHGHALTPENRVDSQRRRRCVECSRRTSREFMRKRRATDPEGVRQRKREWARRRREAASQH